MKKYQQIILFFIVTLGVSSCKKFLDAKSDKKLSVVNSVEDVQAVLDAYAVISSAFPTSLEVSSDDYYVSDNNLNLEANQSFDSDTYLWRKNANDPNQWQAAYKVVAHTNVAIKELNKMSISNTNKPLFNSVLGTAHFLRGYYFFLLNQLWGQPYNPQTANNDLGIPLRLSTNINEISVRSTEKACYDQILADLKISAELLPIKQILKTRPSKSAALGAISKAYLCMQQFDSAARYSDLSLELYDSLMDFNAIDPSSLNPIPQFNKEVVFHLVSGYTNLLQTWICKIDSSLIESYDEIDLRKSIFYLNNGANKYSFKAPYGGYYRGLTLVFGGLTTSELFLISAECNARLGNLKKAVDNLNELLINRIKTGDYSPFNSTNKDEIIARVIKERRKELVFRGVRWSDLKRYQLESDKVIVPKRKVNGQIFELLPNSPRYALAIPAQVINLSGMPQNP